MRYFLANLNILAVADSTFGYTATEEPSGKRARPDSDDSDGSGSDLGDGYRSSQGSDYGDGDHVVSGTLSASDDDFVPQKKVQRKPKLKLKLSGASKSMYSTNAGPSARLPLASTSKGRGAGGVSTSGIFDESRDFMFLPLKTDHATRPLYLSPASGNIILEAFHPLAPAATDFLIAIAEPVSRPSHIHEYKLTPHSLYAAVSVGLKTDDIIEVLNRMSKVPVPDEIRDFIRDCTVSYGKVKLVLKKNKHYVESGHAETLRALLQDEIISKARAITAEADVAEAAAHTPATYGIEKDKAPKRAGLIIPGTKAAGAIGAEDLTREQDNEKGKDKAVEEDLFTAVVGLEKGVSSFTSTGVP